MIRRGFLAGLGAMIGAGKATAAGNLAAARGALNTNAGWPIARAMASDSEGLSAGVASDGPYAAAAAARKAYHAYMQPIYRRRKHQRAVVELLGGMPPHVASCHSWAPWFRAHKAATWALDQAETEDGIERHLRRTILGED